MYDICSKNNKLCHYWFPKLMDHNSYDINKDILIPIDNFFKTIKYKISNDYDYILIIPE